ncbi:MAG: FGGY-family carbohydrate kinase, partial [Kiritimatiellia bacterium]
PETRGAITRMICESLALTYRITADQLTELVGNELAILHVVGGGCQNRLLNQFSANALGRKVIAGPVEATAMGNVLSQLTADGTLPDLQAGRRLIHDSIDIDVFEPHEPEAWDAALERFLQLWG